MGLADVVCWVELHPGVASWVQAVGAIVSIWGAFAISNSQQKSQQKIASRAAMEKAEAMTAVVESAVSFISTLGSFVQQQPGVYVFKENWNLVNRQWLESSVYSLSLLPPHELGNGARVKGYLGITGAINDIGRLIRSAVNSEAFQEQEYFFMYEEVLKQVRIVESNWRSFHQASLTQSRL